MIFKLNSNNKAIRALIEEGIHPHWLKAEAKLVKPLLREYRAWLKPHERAVSRQTLVKFLCYRLKQELSNIDRRREQYTQFNKHYSNTVNINEKRQHILDYARTLGASKRHIHGDNKAFSRWFGQDAVAGRYQRHLKMSERRLAFFLKRLGVLASIVLSEERLNLENAIKPLLQYPGDTRVRIEALRCLSKCLKQLPEQIQEDSVSSSTLQYIYRACVDYQENVWIQCEALNLLDTFSIQSLPVILKKRFTEPGDGDDLFVRQQAVHLWGRNLQRLPELLELIPVIVKDTSPFVRQALAKTLVAAPVDIVQIYLRQLVCEDEVAAVRAAALLEILSLLPRAELNAFLLQLLVDSLSNDKDKFVLRVGLKLATDATALLIESSAEQAIVWQETLLKKIEEIHCASDKPTAVRRWAAQAAERLWCDMEPETRVLRSRLQEELQTVKPAQAQRLARKPSYDESTLARVLAVISQADFGYDIKRNWFNKTIIRGHRFGFRWWRLIHEFRHPSPDKRQAFPHTTGRHFSGQLRIPSGILSEVAETKVPGEPLLIGSDADWRPYLPLVDELIDCLHKGALEIYTSEGITTVQAPKSWWRRRIVDWKLTWHFSHYAHLRNWQEKSQTPVDTYIKEVQNLGFRVDYKNHTYPTLPDFRSDQSVQRFFPLVLPFGDFQEIWQRISEYFFSVYQNTFQDLAIFSAAALAFFVTTHVYANHLLNRTRANIPLVIGGWGTRGKSGTERIKAAMLNALGYSIFSKTTGCEAMFLYADPFDATREMFLFRPYDKATIWEHYNVLRLADKMNMDIFLWECMGLTPAYVEILQRQWTRDDISTITNTYPDHEDLQGPAGINIPQVMTNFIPRHATLVTSEEQMWPILQAAANELKTGLRIVNWLQAGLLTPDVLERFPYEEHPYNIALVLAVGDELGVPADFALKEMADRVVLDIGVLKSYPIAPLQTRRLEFLMGMSANERFGCLNNWTRMGLADQDPEKEPDVWISTLVNNRADRIARSRVFASLLVEDISADQHFFVGTNLTGMVGYIREVWEDYVIKKTLWSDDTQALTKAARAFRIPITEEHIQARLRVMLNSQGDFEHLLSLWQQPQKLYESLSVDADNAKAIFERLKQDLENYKSYKELAAKLENATQAQHSELDEEFRRLLWQWFEQKLVVIHDPYTPGNQIIKRIGTHTPPGFHNRIMGMQNIKGTGLDFVYRWQAWETCYKALSQLKSQSLRIAEEGLNALVSFQEYGPLSEEYVRQTIAQVKETEIGKRAYFQAHFMLILDNLKRAMTEINTQGESESQTGGFWQTLIEWLEAFLDAGDAVKRRKKADQIYKDLASERVSYQRAALELQKLNKRQKGGWLSAKLANWRLK
ncbi:MAG: hypothetical protein ABFS56_23815 [Pseudomonadota bacterium]